MNCKHVLILCSLIIMAACQGEVRVMSQDQDDSPENLVRGKTDDRFHRMSVTLRVRLPVGTAICSGTLIEKDVVLTAAHCFEGLQSPVADDAITVEATAQLARYGLGQRFESHPQFQTDARRFDLALVKLELSAEPASAIEIMRNEFANVQRPARNWIPDEKQSLILTGSGIKIGFLEAPFKQPLVEAANFRGSVEIERAGSLRTVWDFFSVSSLVAGDLLSLSAGQNSPWLCAGDSGGGLFVENEDKSLMLVGVNSRSKMFRYQGKTLCMPSGMIATPISPYLSWIESTIRKLQNPQP